jgi:VIT1/CCC1 family predicted Fe2+/Mn2+ transporter
VPTAVFGGWDGCISILAVMVGLAASGHTAGAVIAGVCGAVGGTFSMATGQYVSASAGAGRLRQAGVMGVASGVGGMIPVLPFLATSDPAAATIAAIALAFAMAVAVAAIKARSAGRPLTARDLLVDCGLLAVTAAATFAVGLA